MLEERKDIEVALKAIQVKGVVKQLAKCSEELTELAAECSRAIVEDRVDTKKLAEEYADVKFTMLQIALIMGGSEENKTFENLVNTTYEYKVLRTNELLDLDIREAQARFKMEEEAKKKEKESKQDVSDSGNKQ